MQKMKFMLAVIALGLIIPSPIYADWGKVGPEVQVNTYTTSFQDEPSVAGLSDGGFVVMWESKDDQDGSSYGVFGQRFDGAGNKVGSEFQVNTYTFLDQMDPSVAGLSDGGFVVTWMSYQQVGIWDDVFGQRFDSSGNKVGSEFQVNTYTSDDQGWPSVAGLSGGGFVVTWDSYQQDGSGDGVYGQRFSSSGNKVGGEFQVNTYTYASQQWCSVAGLSDGGFVVTWESYEQDGGGHGIFGQRFNSSGNKVGSEFQVNTHTPDDQEWPSVAGLSGGGFVVTWDSAGQDGGNDGIFGQRFNSSGNKVGGEFQVNTHTPDGQKMPCVAGLSGGGFVVTWHSYGQDGSDAGVFGQTFDNAGSKVGNEFQVNTYYNGNQDVPSVAGLSDGGFFVSWESYGQDGSDEGVFGQRYNTSGVEWTVMVYLDGDNDLEEFAIGDLNEMESVGSNDDFNVVVQLDRHPDHDSSNGNWTTCRRYYVTQDTDPNIINSTLIADIGEVNMGDPDTLRDFATWAVTNYPAQKYMLVLWDHGSGWKTLRAMSGDEPPPLKGVCYDDSSGGDALTNADLKSALSNILSSTGLSKIDCLGFDACLMQMIEVAYDVRTYASYMIGSEDVEWAYGWDYTFLNKLINDPSCTPAQLATKVVNKYQDRTQSAIDLSTVVNLKNKVEVFAQELILYHCEYCEEITNARTSSQQYSDDDYIDLYDFAWLITQSSVPASMIGAAQNVMNRVNNSVIANKVNVPNSHGISIYYPEDCAQYNSKYSKLDFAHDTSWDDFVRSVCCPHYVTVIQQKLDGTQVLKTYSVPTEVGGETGPAIASDRSFGNANESSNKIAIAGVDIDGDGIKEIATIQQKLNGKQFLKIYNAPTEVGGETGPAIVKDDNFGHANKDRKKIAIAGADVNGDGIDELAVIQQKLSGKQSLKIYEYSPYTSTTIEWQKTFGGSDYDHAYSVQETAGGGYIVAGLTDSFGADPNGSLVLSLDANGEIPGCNAMGASQAIVHDTSVSGQDTNAVVQNSYATVSNTSILPQNTSVDTSMVCFSSASLWAMTYTGTDWDAKYSVEQTSDGGYIVGCRTLFYGAGERDFWVWKFNSDGTVAWQKTYGGSQGDYLHSIHQTQDGGYIVAGWTHSFGGGTWIDAWVLKLNSNGSVSWQKTYGGSDSDYIQSIRQTSDGGFVMAGMTDSFDVGGRDLWVLKLNANGSVAWQKAYGGPGGEYGYSICQTTDGGYIVVADTSSFGPGYRNWWVLKLDFNGNVVWQKAFGGGGWEYVRTIQQTADGGYIVAGHTYSSSFGAGGEDAWILKLHSDGTIAWQKTFGGSKHDRANSIQQTSDGGFVVVGKTASSGSGSDDFWILKITADPQPEPETMLSLIASDVSFGNALGINNNIALAGVDIHGDGIDEIAVIRENANHGKQRLYIFNAPIEVGGETGPEIASDTSFGNANQDSRKTGLARVDINDDGIDEIAVIKQRLNGKQNLVIYNVPTAVGGETGAGIANDTSFGNATNEKNMIAITGAGL